MLRSVKRDLAKASRDKAQAFAMADAIDRWADGALFSRYDLLAVKGLAAKLRSCGHGQRAELQGDDEDFQRVVLKNRSACKNRVACYSCMRTRARHMRNVALRLPDYVWRQKPGARVISAVLTLQNAPFHDGPRPMFDTLSTGVVRLLKNRRVKTKLLGTLGSFEVAVRGTPEAPEWGWHVHLTAFAPSTYYDAWISQADWRALFRDAARVDYLPVVHVKGADGGSELENEAAVRALICEQLKYNTKIQSYCHIGRDGSFVINPEIPLALHFDLKSRMMVRHTGIVSAGLKHARIERAQARSSYATASYGPRSNPNTLGDLSCQNTA